MPPTPLDVEEFPASAAGHRAGRGFGRPCRFSWRSEVGIEEDDAFHVVRRLIGKGGENMKFIAQESGGAHVRVVGRGAVLSQAGAVSCGRTVGGPLAVFVSAPTRGCLEDAVGLVEDLLDRVREEYNIFMESRA